MKVPTYEPKISETKHVHPWFKTRLKRHFPDVYIYKPPAGQFGKKGTHDFIFCIKGLFFSVEIKVGDNKMTPKQVETYDFVLQAGGFSACCTDKDESFFDQLKHHIANFKIED